MPVHVKREDVKFWYVHGKVYSSLDEIPKNIKEDPVPFPNPDLCPEEPYQHPVHYDSVDVTDWTFHTQKQLYYRIQRKLIMKIYAHLGLKKPLLREEETKVKKAIPFFGSIFRRAHRMFKRIKRAVGIEKATEPPSTQEPSPDWPDTCPLNFGYWGDPMNPVFTNIDWNEAAKILHSTTETDKEIFDRSAGPNGKDGLSDSKPSIDREY